jgi:hypothetical protein
MEKNELFLILYQITEGLHFYYTDYRNQPMVYEEPPLHRNLKPYILYLNSNQIVLSDFETSTIIEQNGNGQINNNKSCLCFLSCGGRISLNIFDWNSLICLSPEILVGTIECEENALHLNVMFTQLKSFFQESFISFSIIK